MCPKRFHRATINKYTANDQLYGVCAVLCVIGLLTVKIGLFATGDENREIKK